MASLIGLDWGTTSLRAALLDRDGTVLDRQDSTNGLGNVKDGDFEGAFEAAAGAWCDRHPELPIVLSGMIGARTGWKEAPYVACPADIGSVAEGFLVFRTARGRELRIVPGLSTRDVSGTPDVMRGEETQIFGSLDGDGGSGMFVLPGTHSKWARVKGGRITGFATYLTGELFAALKGHTILGRTMSGDAFDAEAFTHGVTRAADGTGGGILRRLFGVRALGLFGELSPEASASWLSGLIIGTEMVEAKAEMGKSVTAVTIVGGAGLSACYAAAAEQVGLEHQLADSDAAFKGQARLARKAGLIGGA